MESSSNRGNVCISMIWKDKEWILPYTLRMLTLLNYPKEKIGIRFVVMPVSFHDQKDETFRSLMNFKRVFFKLYRFISVWTVNTGNTRTEKPSNGNKRNGDWNMQLSKNLLMDAVSKKDEYVFYVDSSVLLEENSLNHLINLDKDVVAGLCLNQDYINIGQYDPNMNSFDNSFDYKKIISDGVPTKVAFVSDMMLFRYWISKKIKFYQSNKLTSSEDDGAMRDMMKNNIDRWFEPKALGSIMFNEKELDDFVKKTNIDPLILPDLLPEHRLISA